MFDLTKPYQCRNGDEAKVTEQFEGLFWGRRREVHGDFWTPMRWHLETGDNIKGCSDFDLINTTEIVEKHQWVNIYENGYIGLFWGSETELDKRELDRNIKERLTKVHLLFRIDKTNKTCDVIQVKDD